MAFSQVESPVYGGGTIIIDLSRHEKLTEDISRRFYLVFEGQLQRHITKLWCHEHTAYISIIPAHHTGETVRLSVLCFHGNDYSIVESTPFRYYYDSAYYMAQFLVESVYNVTALDDLELIRSDYFDLSNEVLDTLDQRLYKALTYLEIPDWWHLLGPTSPLVGPDQQPRETLLHFTARLGLDQVASFLLDKPGSEQALLITNRHGSTPRDVAEEQGHTGLAEVLTEYNPYFVKVDSKPIQTDYGVVTYYSDRDVSLSTYLQRSVEEEVHILRHILRDLEKGGSPLYQRQSQTDWPDNPNMDPENQNAFEEQTDTKLKAIISKSKDLQVVMEALGHVNDNSDNTVDLDSSPARSIDDEFSDHVSEKELEEGGMDGSQGDVYVILRRCPLVAVRTYADFLGAASPEHYAADTEHSIPLSHIILTLSTPVLPLSIIAERQAGGEKTTNFSVLEGSLAGLHGLNQELQKQRDYDRLTAQDVRKENLSRFSSSCPSLEATLEGRATLQPEIDEGHHRSMLNLAKDEEQSATLSIQLAGESTSDIEELHHVFSSNQENQDASVQICINGVTVESPDDFRLDASLNKFLREFYGGNTPGVRRRSWGPNYLDGQKLQLHHEGSAESLDGKSMSLNSLDGDEDTEDDEDLYHDAKEMQTPNTSQVSLDPTEVEMALSISPTESPCSSPMSKDMPDASMYGSPDTADFAGESTLVRTLYNIQQELITPRDKKTQRLQQQEMLSGQSGESADEDSSVLTVPHSNMTKSLSTPSIPHAVSPGERKGHKDPKQHDGTPTYLLIQKLIEEHDAQFRRQDEIEEDDDENTNRLLGQSDHNRRRSELSLIDFLNDPSNLEEQSKSSKKEDKKRKISVFSRLQNSYRTKKHKEKDNKGKTTHQFVSVSFSNSTMCHVCRKSMANKPALRCENCLVNVHESSCKDQIIPCDRYGGNKVPQLTREAPVQMTNVLLREKQSSLPTSVPGLRQTQSFKEKRSSSGPTGRAQVTSTPLSASTQGSPQQQAPLSSIADIEPDSVSQNTEQYQKHRRSLPSASLYANPSITRHTGYSAWKKARELLIGGHIDKAINEEVEGDLFGSGLDHGQSNITDTISESLESLDETDSTTVVSEQFDEELLKLRQDEAETWSGSVEKKALRKMNNKDIKRQDTIWELIQTERHHCRTLKILQRIYKSTMLVDLDMSPEIVERLFPKLDDLIDIHMTFLRDLQDLQSRRPDHSIEHIGETLVVQFHGEKAVSMKKAYGAFCCGQKDSGQLYKDLLKDRKFLTYMKKCNNHNLCQKREIPDFLLLVTQRPSKYLTLIEAILKSTKDKKDRENLIQALNLSKELLQSIDEQVSEHERRLRLIDIYHRMDQRATATYRGKKFKKSDLLNGRQLIHEGVVGLKNARSKVTDVTAVVLTDLVFFMQEANGKYTFFSQDNKSCVIPLFQLLVREKGDTRDSRGIYLISQDKKSPEMYEIVCNSSNDRRIWVNSLRTASEKCPEDAEEAPTDESEEEKKMEARSAKVKDIIDQLHVKDQEIKQCCDEKNRLMGELLDLYNYRQDSQGKRPSSMVEEEGTEHMDALQAAIQEVSVTASRLTTMLQGNGSHLSRHVSSVGEHVSSSFSLVPLPKRAETFSGFDNSYESPKGQIPKKKYIPELHSMDIRSASPQQLDKTDSDSEVSHIESANYEKHVEHDDSLEGIRVGERYSDAESLGDISGSSTQSSMLLSGDHMTSLSQLARSLHSIVHLTAQQGTAVETLRAQLAEANERINKLSNEVHEKKGGYRHNQLEELRNLQEMVRREKQEFERKKEQEHAFMELELNSLEDQRLSLKQKEDEMEHKREMMNAEIQTQKEELRIEKERLQAQIELWKKNKCGPQEPGQLHKNASAPGITQQSSEQVESKADGVQLRDHSPDPNSQTNNHRRSQSADFCQMIENDLDKMRQGQKKSTARNLLSRTDPQRSGYSSFSNTHSSASKMNLPEHLLSAKNEQKVTGSQKVKQQIPSRSGLSASASTPAVGAKGGVQQMLPHKLAASGSSSSLSGVSGTTGQSTNNSASQQGQQKAYHSNRTNFSTNKPASTSSLSLVMKLAEPGSNKGRSSSLTTVSNLLLGEKSQAQKSASVDVPSLTAQGSTQGQTDKKSSDKADDEIYC